MEPTEAQARTQYSLFNWGSSFCAVPMPTIIASWRVRILHVAPRLVSEAFCRLRLDGAAHQCVMIMLSLPLRMSCFPPAPAIFASSDCANVSVTNGRCGEGAAGGRDVDSSPSW